MSEATLFPLSQRDELGSEKKVPASSLTCEPHYAQKTAFDEPRTERGESKLAVGHGGSEATGRGAGARARLARALPARGVVVGDQQEGRRL